MKLNSTRRIMHLKINIENHKFIFLSSDFIIGSLFINSSFNAVLVYDTHKILVYNTHKIHRHTLICINFHLI